MTHQAAFLLAFAACSGTPSADKADGPAAGDDSGLDTASGDDTAAAPVEGCHATPAPADRERLVVVSFPYDDDANPVNRWSSYRLSPEGRLSEAEGDVEMGRAWIGAATFTPDAAFGYVVQDDGSVGVFADKGDHIEVVDPAWDQGLYASGLAMHPSGERIYLIDGNWPNNGGGLYVSAIDCDTGALSAPTLLVASKLPARLVLRGEEGLLASLDVPGGAAGDDLALLDLSTEPPAWRAGLDAFGDDDTVIADLVALGGHAVLSDNAFFFDHPTRMSVVAWGEGSLERKQNIDVEDPITLVPSPFGDQLLVISGFGDAIYRYAYEADAAEPLTSLGALSTTERPAVPGAAAWVSRGALRGLVLVSEAEGLRTVMLGEGATAEDLGRVAMGSGLSALPGAVGIAP